MKRNALLALLVAVSTTSVGLSWAAPASAGIECRYSIKSRAMATAEDTDHFPELAPDSLLKVDGVDQLNPFWRTFRLSQPKWSVVGVRADEGFEYDLSVRECPDEPLATSAQRRAVDFVALDGNAEWTTRFGEPKSLYAVVTLGDTEAGPFSIEYSTGGSPLRPRAPEELTLRGTPAVVRDIYVASGTTAVITLQIADGDADLAVMDSLGAAPDTAARSRSDAIAQSANPGLEMEYVEITVPETEPGRIFGVVVVNNAVHGQYTLTWA